MNSKCKFSGPIPLFQLLRSKILNNYCAKRPEFRRSWLDPSLRATLGYVYSAEQLAPAVISVVLVVYDAKANSSRSSYAICRKANLPATRGIACDDANCVDSPGKPLASFFALLALPVLPLQITIPGSSNVPGITNVSWTAWILIRMIDKIFADCLIF